MALTARTNAAGCGKAFSAAPKVAPKALRRTASLRVRAGEAAAAETKKGIETSMPAMKAALDIEAIKGILPHR